MKNKEIVKELVFSYKLTAYGAYALFKLEYTKNNINFYSVQYSPFIKREIYDANILSAIKAQELYEEYCNHVCESLFLYSLIKPWDLTGDPQASILRDKISFVRQNNFDKFKNAEKTDVLFNLLDVYEEDPSESTPEQEEELIIGETGKPERKENQNEKEVGIKR